ncbi:Murein DD-endopeptidase MepM and murein hydrolase activator NlpD, contain LysM domain [Methylobacterium sp. 190mf]|uniref:M23 family metallopeptidase n=1 Tax=Methylobacterium sp. 190mf TaxID=1761798 RepID=UPI00089E3B6C|nr:M23 family metallopeptidase [Methylobacterium sp. 190mf]SEF40830.1 Murein DD-endopeptidase MepM and murein hydrolase activator NlpD, contain LysM domain [Methylobacterium sp. 190mf]
MAGFTIADFFASVSFKADDASRSRAEGSYAKFEKAVRDAEDRITKAKAEGAKAAVRYALEVEAAQAREALEAAKAAKKITDAEAQKVKAIEASEKATKHHSETMVRGLTAITLAAGTMGLAVGAALAKVVGAFDNLYFASQRTGASVKNIQSLQYAFSQVGSTGASATSAIESFARQMRTNLTGGFIRSLGVATEQGGKARDTFDILSDTIDAISTKHPYHTGAQMAEVLGLSEEQFETFNKHRAEIKQFRAEYESTLKTVGLNSQEAAKQSEHLEQTLRRMGMQIGVAGQALLLNLLPVLDRLVASVGRFMTDNAPALNGFFSKVGELAQTATEGVQSFIQGFSGEEGAKRIEAWATAMNNLADGMRGVWRVIAWIQDSAFWKALTYFESPLWKFLKYAGGSAVGSAQASTGGGSVPLDSGPVDTRNAWQRHAPKWLGGKDAPSGGATVASGRLADNQKTAYDAARAEGLSDKAARALIANFSGESLRNPADYHWDNKHMSGGIGQWDPERSEAIKAKFGKYPWQLPIGEQVKAAVWEINNNPRFSRTRQALAGDDEGAMIGALVKNYENPANHDRAIAERSAHYRGFNPNAPTISNAPQVSGGFHPLGGLGRFTSDYGMRNHPISGGRRMHNGVDLAAPAGSPVSAMQGGKVSIGRSGDVTITAGDGSSTTYRHVDASVKDGSEVAAGAVIAALRAKDARSTGPHLHFEARDRSGNLIDPKGLLTGKPVTAADAMAAKPQITVPSMPKLNMSPGGFDVNKIAGQPMGAGSITTTTNNAGATVTMQPQTTVHIHGGDPASNASQFERAAGRVNQSALRNIQTAIR